MFEDSGHPTQSRSTRRYGEVYRLKTCYNVQVCRGARERKLACPHQCTALQNIPKLHPRRMQATALAIIKPEAHKTR